MYEALKGEISAFGQLLNLKGKSPAENLLKLSFLRFFLFCEPSLDSSPVSKFVQQTKSEWTCFFSYFQQISSLMLRMKKYRVYAYKSNRYRQTNNPINFYNFWTFEMQLQLLSTCYYLQFSFSAILWIELVKWKEFSVVVKNTSEVSKYKTWTNPGSYPA